MLVLGVLVVGLILLYFLIIHGIVTVPAKTFPGARTLYTGYVKIERTSLAEIKAMLEKQGCHTNDYQGETTNRCVYRETIVEESRNGFIILPHGPGWGPISFSLTEDKLWDVKDIPGSPNPDKFKDEVRKDVDSIDNIVKIKENTWKITGTKYPWTVLY